MSATPQTSHNTLVINAAGEGDLNKVIRLVEKHNYDVNQQERNDGATPLSMAVYYGKVDVVRYLIRKNADINMIVYGKTALFIATEHGRLDMMLVLLAAGADIDKPRCDLMTPLAIAAQIGLLEVVQILVAKGASTRAARDRRGDSGMTPLHAAAENGHVAVVDCLLEAGANLEDAFDNGVRPLWVAAARGHHLVVDSLLQKGADMRARNDDGESPFYAAAEGGHLAVLWRLFLSPANVEEFLETTTTAGATPLWIASKHGHLKVVQFLVSVGGAVKDKGCCSYSRTPLMCACEGGHLKVAEVLLGQGCDPNKTDTEHMTAFHLTAFGMHVDIAKLLVRYGANMEDILSDISPG